MSEAPFSANLLCTSRTLPCLSKMRDMVFRDNRSLMHPAAGTPDHLRRKLCRTTIEGDTPF